MESGKAGTAGKSRKHLSFYEARELVETSTPVAASKSYAAAVKVSTTSIATQTDLTWPNAEDKFKKIFDLENAKKKKAAKAAKNQDTKSTQVSLDSRNPSNDLTGEPCPSKSKTGKDTKNQKKGRLKKIERNIIPIDNPFESLVNMDDKNGHSP